MPDGSRVMIAQHDRPGAGASLHRLGV